MMNATSKLWERYRSKGDPKARAELLDHHLGLVYHIAHQLSERLPGEVELDDLISAGTLGLVRALASFEPARGLEFSTYATPRIRGAILDELRQRDWVPRSVRQKMRQLNGAVSDLESRNRRAPTHTEVADQLEIDLDTYWRWRREVDNAVLIPLDEPPSRDSDGVALSEKLSSAFQASVDHGIEREELAKTLRSAIAELGDKERTVLALYYYEELNLRQIAAVLHLTESRISQIRTKALQRLRQRLSPVREGL